MVLDKPIKVMLVDDDPSIHESLRDVVEEVGYEFCSALSGREGLRLLDEERPDLLLLDVMMPGMNGFDVCRQIREEGRRIPIIFLTAKNDIVDKSTGFGAGADDYVTKPFIADELLLRIDAHVRRHRDDMRHRQGVRNPLAFGGKPRRGFHASPHLRASVGRGLRGGRELHHRVHAKNSRENRGQPQ